MLVNKPLKDMDLFFFPYFCNPSPSCISAAVDKSLNNICDPLNVNISGSDTEFSGLIKIDFDLNYLVGIRVCLFFFFINFQNFLQGKLKKAMQMFFGQVYCIALET